MLFHHFTRDLAWFSRVYGRFMDLPLHTEKSRTEQFRSSRTGCWTYRKKECQISVSQSWPHRKYKSTGFNCDSLLSVIEPRGEILQLYVSGQSSYQMLRPNVSLFYKVYDLEGQFYISYKARGGPYIRYRDRSIMTDFYKAQVQPYNTIYKVPLRPSFIRYGP